MEWLLRAHKLLVVKMATVVRSKVRVGIRVLALLLGSIVLQLSVSHLEKEEIREASRRYYSPGLVSAANKNQVANLHFVDILMELRAGPKGSLFEACIAATSFPDSDILHSIHLANVANVPMESRYITPISRPPTFCTWI